MDCGREGAVRQSALLHAVPEDSVHDWFPHERGQRGGCGGVGFPRPVGRIPLDERYGAEPVGLVDEHAARGGGSVAGRVPQHYVSDPDIKGADDAGAGSVLRKVYVYSKFPSPPLISKQTSNMHLECHPPSTPSLKKLTPESPSRRSQPRRPTPLHRPSTPSTQPSPSPLSFSTPLTPLPL